MKLDEQTFIDAVAAVPLVAVDLVLSDEAGRVLLGKRTNRPAQGYWFVPGGRIRKGERVQKALKRVSLSELGVQVEGFQLLGVFDHLYEDNFLGKAGVSTQYVTLGYRCSIALGTAHRADDQHSEIRWWTVEELLASEEVHENTKAYFRSEECQVKVPSEKCISS